MTIIMTNDQSVNCATPLRPLQDQVEAPVRCGSGAPGRGQQDVPALPLPVPSSPAHPGPIPVPELSAALPAGSAPAAAPPPEPRSRAAAPLAVEPLEHHGGGQQAAARTWSSRWPAGGALQRVVLEPWSGWEAGRVCGSWLDRTLSGSSRSSELLSFSGWHELLTTFSLRHSDIMQQLYRSLWLWVGSGSASFEVRILLFLKCPVKDATT